MIQTLSDGEGFMFQPPLIKQLSKHIVSSVMLSLLILFSTAHAKPLSSFEAQFEVEALGLTLGKAKHRMQCQANTCTLTSHAKPSGFAAAFFKDSSIETIQLKQDETTLSWLSYHKLGISYKDGNKREKETNVKLVTDSNEEDGSATVISPEKNKTWPAQSKQFDLMSIAYAIQHAKLNAQSLHDFTLQDTNFQDKLTLASTNENDFITLDFADDDVDAVKYRFTSKHAEIELWLLPNYDFFPGKIRIVNKEDKTITLSLAEPPKTL